MTVHSNGKTSDDVERMLTLMHAVADTDTSVSPRALADAYVASQHKPLFIPGEIVESARAATARERRSSSVADEAKSPRLKARRSAGEALLVARTKDIAR